MTLEHSGFDSFFNWGNSEIYVECINSPEMYEQAEVNSFFFHITRLTNDWVKDREIKCNFPSGLQWKNFNVTVYHNTDRSTVIFGQTLLESKQNNFLFYGAENALSTFFI